ncbi:MAG: non-hydrolyzing UDP-N-acetylglucosamine 2-epimerase, partial [Methermicoccaceae archaeon]
MVGARPQFIKCAPLSRAIRQEHEEVLVHTGQHYDTYMSDVFFDELDIPLPDYNLEVGSGSHGVQTAQMLQRLEPVLLDERPDLVIVYGDTNSTLAGALAAAKLNIDVAHVEAGLRSFDRTMPEELNRRLTDHLSRLLFCPTSHAVGNLKHEGIVEGVYMVGDVMVDALLDMKKKILEHSDILTRLGLSRGRYSIATLHRASNTDDHTRLRAITKAFCDCGEHLVFPVHPRTKKALMDGGLWRGLEGCRNVQLIEPVGYGDMLSLVSGAKRVLTDSGGLQKEAYVLGVPCITMRESTEWVETVEDGWNVLVGADYDAIVKAARSFSPSGNRSNVYGSGDASNRML